MAGAKEHERAPLRVPERVLEHTIRNRIAVLKLWVGEDLANAQQEGDDVAIAVCRDMADIVADIEDLLYQAGTLKR